MCVKNPHMKYEKIPRHLFEIFQCKSKRCQFGLLFGIVLFVQAVYEAALSYLPGENSFVLFSPYALLAKSFVIAALVFFVYRKFSVFFKDSIKKELLQITVENLPEAIYWVDAEGSFFYMNESAEKIFDCHAEDGKQMSVYDLYRHDPRYDRNSWQMQWDNTKQKKRLMFESRHSTKEGPVVDVEILVFHATVSGSEYLVGHVRDISSKKRLQHRMSDVNRGLQRKNEELERLHDVMSRYVPISKTDAQGVITYANEALCEMTGYPHEELMGRSHSILRHPDTDELVYSRLWRTIAAGSVWSDVLQNRKKDGVPYWVNVHIHPDYDSNGRKTGYTAIYENITDKIKLEKLASTDSLTKIYNRNKFNEVLSRRLLEIKRYDETFSLILCDLDHFKEVNDVYGHKYGDKVLQKFVAVARQGLRKSDFFARWGGEEFVILLPHTELKEAQQTALKIKELLENTIFESIAKITASFGVTEVRADDSEATLFERVDKAMYRAKAEGRNRISVS